MTEKCVLCGICRSYCPVYRTTLKETDSPRTKAFFANSKRNDAVFFKCTLCGNCTNKCPYGAEINVAKIRANMVNQGITTEANKKIVETIKETGNPYKAKEEQGPQQT